MKLLTIEFEFDGGYHYALIHKKEKDGAHLYHVTVMNGRLEQLLYGNHIINEVNGSIVLEDGAANDEQARLKKIIATALRQHLEKQMS